MSARRHDASARASRFAARLAMPLLATACTTTGATFRSGVGDTYPERAPYYAGKIVTRDMRLGFFPISYQRGATMPENFDLDPRGGSALGALLADMNRYLDSLAVATALAGGPAPRGTPPDVQFGCVRSMGTECDERNEDAALGRGRTNDMRLAVGRPSKEWTSGTASALDSAGVPNVLVISVEISDYFMRQTGVRGNKEVELGTGYTVPLPWMTGLQHPVNVLQLTGAVMNRDGTAMRIGAEGMLAKRTGMLAGALGGQEVITDKDVAEFRMARRTDLAGQPLVWQVALRNLVAELTGRAELAMR
ncbi:MAG: hypothetical protein ACJ79K_04225 [Gemmatimonadaceae bacterium]